MRHVARALAALLVCATPAAASSDRDAPTPAPRPVTIPEVVGGQQAAPGRWDDAAGVYFTGDNSGPECTGTLIAPDVVITAGHCIGGVASVRLGVNDFSAAGGERINVTQEIEYPSSQSSHDVGVLVLATPSTLQPRVVAAGCALDRLENGSPVAIVGYGATDTQGSQYTTMLMEAQSTITDFDCSTSSGCNGLVSPGGELGAGGSGIDSCFGDSGGPLYLLTEDLGNYLVGVTSRGYNDSTSPCGDGGIYGRPDSVMEWIGQATGRTIPLALCQGAPPASADTELHVEPGEAVSTTIDIADPGPAGTYRFAIDTSAMAGEATVADDGTVTYQAPMDMQGTDTFTVRVNDNREPLAAQVAFTVDVSSGGGGGCGCRSAGGNPSASILLLAALVPLRLRRRRRR